MSGARYHDLKGLGEFISTVSWHQGVRPSYAGSMVSTSSKIVEIIEHK